MAKLRIIIDANVLISGIVFGGKPRRLLDLLSEDALVVVIAEEMLTEVRRKIVLKFPDFIEDYNRVEKLLKRDCIIVRLGSAQVKISRDPDDDKYIEAALLGHCNYIITGDNDLLVIGQYENIGMIKPADFLKQFRHKD
ncbi:MAG: putative toxin-antitoxin system toxin component, PIN family [Candidatus Saccharimonadales bacterium]